VQPNIVGGGDEHRSDRVSGQLRSYRFGLPDVDEGAITGRDAGGLSEVERVGETVRRAAGSWTPAVHALLTHLEGVGFDGAPRPLGYDAAGREVLTFVAGCGASHGDEELVRVAQLIRAYHDAVATFQAPADAEWQFMVGAPRTGEVVCHNDLSPDNTIYGDDGTPRAFIDWDLAAPGPRLWDVAWAVYRFVPLYDDQTCARLGYPVRPRAARLRIFCDAYRLGIREALLETVCERIRVLYDTARAWGEDGRPGWREVWRDTRGDQWLAGLRYVEAHQHQWEQELGTR
jgi:Phosphotransferase enzyme family